MQETQETQETQENQETQEALSIDGLINNEYRKKMRVFFLLWLVLELFVFFCVAEWIGFGWAILLLLLPMVFGGAIMRWQGMHLIQKMQRMQQEGKLVNPAAGVFDGIALAFAGILLMIPGFITTIMALLLFIPVCRQLLMRSILNKALKKFATHSKAQYSSSANSPQFTDDRSSHPTGRTIDHDSGKEVE